MGWPEGCARLSDCTLKKQCSDEERIKLLKELASIRRIDTRRTHALFELDWILAPERLAIALNDVRDVRSQQTESRGVQYTDNLTSIAALVTEVGNAARQLVEKAHWRDQDGFRAAMVQVAARAVEIIESYDRQVATSQLQRGVG